MARGIVADHNCMVFQLEREVLDGRLDVAGHRAGIPSLDRELNVQVGRDAFAFDHGRRRSQAYIGYLSQPDVTAAGRVDQQIADILDAVAYFGLAPHDHVEDLLLL